MPTLLPFTRYENDQALNLLYPSSWQYQVVTEGVLAFASPENLNIDLEEPAVSLLVYRQEPLSAATDLAESFAEFLQKGPLATGYQSIRDTIPTFVGGDEASGREALEALMESQEVDGRVTQVLIVSTFADNGALYTIMATAPQEQWDEWLPNFRVMLGSVEFNE